MSASKSEKKPIFKQAWFWVVIIIVLGGIGIAAGGSNDPAKVGESGSSTEQAETAGGDFKVGDIVSIDGQEITVTSIERNYVPDNAYTKVPSGKEYVKVNIQVQNKSQETKDYNALYFKIETSDGVIDDYMSAALAQAEDSFGSGNLAANGTKKGSIVFEVPKDDKGLKVHFQPSLWSSKEAVINL